MKQRIAQLFRILLLTLSGAVGAVVVGLLVHGSAVFTVGSPGFSFVSFGLSGAFIFAYYHVRGLSETITAAVVVSVIQFILASAWITLLNAGIWSFGVNLPVVALAFLFERKLVRLHQVKFIAVALTYGAVFVLLTLIVSELAGVLTVPAEVFRENFADGVLIGLGLGMGIEACEAALRPAETGAHAHHAA